MYSLIAPPLRQITLPPTAGPGEARIVIGPDLPPPLDTYVILGGDTFAGGIIWYSDDPTPPLDTTYTYECVIANGLGTFTGVHRGWVVGGAVVEVSAGQPMGQRWEANSGPTLATIFFRADSLDLESLGQAGISGDTAVVLTSNGQQIVLTASDITLSAGLGNDINVTAGDDITIDAASDVIIDGASTVDLRTNGTTSSRVLLNSAGVAITAAGAGDDISVTANDQVQLSAAAATSLVTANAAGVTIAANGSGDDVSISAADTVTITATAGAAQMSAGTNTVVANIGGVTIDAATVGGDVTITANDDIVLEPGAAPNGEVNVAGAMAWRSAIGGNPAISVRNFDANGLTTAGTTYALQGTVTPGAIVGTSFVAPPSGRVIIGWRTAIDNNTATGRATIAPEIRTGSTVGSGTVVTAVSDNTAISHLGLDDDEFGSSDLFSGLTGGTTYNVSLWQKSNAAGNNASFARRAVWVIPVL